MNKLTSVTIGFLMIFKMSWIWLIRSNLLNFKSKIFGAIPQCLCGVAYPFRVNATFLWKRLAEDMRKISGMICQIWLSLCKYESTYRSRHVEVEYDKLEINKVNNVLFWLSLLHPVVSAMIYILPEPALDGRM